MTTGEARRQYIVHFSKMGYSPAELDAMWDALSGPARRSYADVLKPLFRPAAPRDGGES